MEKKKYVKRARINKGGNCKWTHAHIASFCIYWFIRFHFYLLFLLKIIIMMDHNDAAKVNAFENET